MTKEFDRREYNSKGEDRREYTSDLTFEDKKFEFGEDSENKGQLDGKCPKCKKRRIRI